MDISKNSTEILILLHSTQTWKKRLASHSQVNATTSAQHRELFTILWPGVGHNMAKTLSAVGHCPNPEEVGQGL